jgi:hypothetical protein
MAPTLGLGSRRLRLHRSSRPRCRGEGEPAWWLNLQAHPDAHVDVAGGPRLVTGERPRARSGNACGHGGGEIDRNLNAYAARRSTETAVVVLEPRQ